MSHLSNSSSAGQLALFEQAPAAGRDQIGEQACLLRGWAARHIEPIMLCLSSVLELAPLRRMPTARGWMSVEQSNCGQYGWVSDIGGYRYTTHDPLTGQAWPDMPPLFHEIAVSAAAEAGFPGFNPQACLINRYVPGSKMGLHQDRDEANFTVPIVSVSLGLPAVFLFGGMRRTDPVAKVPLFHTDVVVWGGIDRLRFHGVMPLKSGQSSSMGQQRINLTFRCVSG